MARNTTLVRLLEMYRAECGLSFNPSHNSQDRERQVQHIQTVQEWLWNEFAWPILRVERWIYPQAGQRYYSLPSDLDPDRITKIEAFVEQAYVPLAAGIDNAQYTVFNSETDQRQWPPQRWQISEDGTGTNGQLELWPIPDGTATIRTDDGAIKVTGIRKLRGLFEDTDQADLDDRLIIMFCAAEYLANKQNKGADRKQQQANALFAKLRNQQTPRRKFSMFGIGTADYKRPTERVPIAVYNKTS